MNDNESQLKILIEEDNEDHALILLKILNKFHYNAKVVENGLQAIDAAREKDYDLIFMDIRMPEMDGVQATKHILHHCSNRKKPTIVAVTAFGHYHERFLEAGISEVILKPISTEMFISVLAEAQARKESETEGLC